MLSWNSLTVLCRFLQVSYAFHINKLNNLKQLTNVLDTKISVYNNPAVLSVKCMYVCDCVHVKQVPHSLLKSLISIVP